MRHHRVGRAVLRHADGVSTSGLNSTSGCGGVDAQRRSVIVDINNVDGDAGGGGADRGNSVHRVAGDHVERDARSGRFEVERIETTEDSGARVQGEHGRREDAGLARETVDDLGVVTQVGICRADGEQRRRWWIVFDDVHLVRVPVIYRFTSPPRVHVSDRLNVAYVKFLQDSVYHSSFKSLAFWRSYSEKQKVGVFVGTQCIQIQGGSKK